MINSKNGVSEGLKGESFGDKTQYEKLMKELKQLRARNDLLESENLSLKKAVFDLSIKLAIAKNDKPDPFLVDSFNGEKSDAIIEGALNGTTKDIEDNSNLNKADFYAATRNKIKTKNYLKPKHFIVEKELTRHDAAVYVVKYSTDGRYLASGSFDKTARVIDLNTYQEICNFNQHRLNVSDVAFNLDNTDLATASFDQHIRLFDISADKMLFQVPTKGFPQCLQFGGLEGELIFTGTSRGILNIIDKRLPEKTLMEIDNGAMINSLLVPGSKSNLVITGDSKGMIKCWDIRYIENRADSALSIHTVINGPTQKPISYISQPNNMPSSRIFGVNSYDNINRIYRYSHTESSMTSNLSHSLQGYKNLNWPIRCSMLGVDKKLIPSKLQTDQQWHLFACGSADPNAYVYLVGPGEDDAQLLQRLEGHRGRVYDVSFNPFTAYTTLATASADCTIKIWTSNHAK